MIHWELCKKFKFDHTNKRLMHNPESVLENETHKLQWDFEIRTDRLTTRPSDSQKKKKKENQPNSELCRSGWQQSKT